MEVSTFTVIYLLFAYNQLFLKHGRSLNLPFEHASRLAKDGADTVHEKWYICNTMQLCPEALCLGVKRPGRCISRSVIK